jgi:phospholipase C
MVCFLAAKRRRDRSSREFIFFMKRSMHRRRFLKLSAGALGAASALSIVPTTISRALGIQANNATGTIMDVEHVVIFMQENRSFDHYFGALNGVRGFGDPRAIKLPGRASVWQQPSGEHPSGYVMPFHGDSTVTNAFRVDGSAQGHQASLTILNGGKFNQWGHTHELHQRMAHYTAKDLPFYYALASSFTICDAYHCSTLTQTYPNRMHLWTGCNGGGKVGGDPEMDNYGEDQTPTSDMATDKPLPRGPLTWTTYAERLEARGISWKVYQEYDNFQDNILSVFKPFRTLSSKDSPLYRRGRSWVSEHETEPAKRTRSDGEPLVAAFRKDLASGALPQVSWIVTSADLSEHPQYEPAKGENVCARLIEALVDNPEIFAKTVFIINYDETGGFFDHMPPPLPPFHPDRGYSSVSTAGEGKDYTKATAPNRGIHPVGLGMRVPGIIVSPWSRGGWVCSEVFDHTSVLRFLEKRFGVREDNISDWRRVVCGDLTSTCDFQTPNQDWTKLTLPSTADFLERVAKSRHSPSLKIPPEQLPTSQEGPQRLARALPYELHAQGRVEDGKFWIDLRNTGSVGAAFQIYDHTDRLGPWHYTLESGKSHATSLWHEGASTESYDLSLNGPNGFFRQFRGDVSNNGQCEVQLQYNAPAGKIELLLVNTGKETCVFEVRQDPAYSVAQGETRSRSFTVAPGSRQSDHWDIAPADHWYDLTVTVKDDPQFLRHCAGHVETGHFSKTDPAIGAMRV